MLRSVLESTDPDSPARRIAAAASATSEVFSDRARAETEATQSLLGRLRQLRLELAGTVASAGTDFKRFAASELLASVDALIDDALRDIERTTRATMIKAGALGAATVDHPLDAARIAVTSGPALDAALVTSAFDNTVDLLSASMRQYRDTSAQLARRVATTGLSQHEAMSRLAQQIGGSEFESVMFQAERIMRTEVGRTFNAATWARMSRLAGELPFLRKGWRSSRDGRTRQGHREAGARYARGSGIPVAELFQVRVYQEFPRKPGAPAQVGKLIGIAHLRFPIDPEVTPPGRIGAGATIMCRCNAFTDLDAAGLSSFNANRSRGVAVVVPPPPIVEPVALPPTPPKPKKPKAPRAPLTAEQAAAKLAKASKVSDLKIAAANAAYEAQRAVVVASDWKDESARERLRELGAKLVKISEAARKLQRRIVYVEADKRVSIAERWNPKDKDEFNDGYSWSQEKGRQYSNVAKVRKRMRDAIRETEKIVGYGSFGRDVLVKRARDQFGTVVDRAFAQAADNSINLSSNEEGHVIAHELGHLLEFNTADLRSAAFRFLERRTAGEETVPLSKFGTGYASHEVTKPDKFTSPYTGKQYFVGDHRYASEVVSMGVEYMYRNPAKFAREDPDYFAFIYNALRGRF